MAGLIVLVIFFYTEGLQANGEIGCSFPSVKEGEMATLSCFFHNFSIPSPTITVNAQGVGTAHPNAGGDLLVAYVANIGEEKPTQIIDPQYQLLNFSVTGGEVELRFLIPRADERYEGLYSCQISGEDISPKLRGCRFALDRVILEVLNSSAVLVGVNVTASTANNSLIQAITVRRGETDPAPQTVELTPPRTNYTLSALEDNTEYRLTVHIGQERFPVNRTVCIPTVRNLTYELPTSESSSVQLLWEPTVCSLPADRILYRVCYSQLHAGELSLPEPEHCLETEVPAVKIHDLNKNTRYVFSVWIMDGSDLPGQFKTVQTRQTDSPKSDGQTVVVAIPVVAALVAILCGVALVLYLKGKKNKKKQKYRKGLGEEDRDAQLSQADVNKEPITPTTTTTLLIENQSSASGAQEGQGAALHDKEEVVKSGTEDLQQTTDENDKNSDESQESEPLTVYKGSTPVMTQRSPAVSTPGPPHTVDLHSSRQNQIL